MYGYVQGFAVYFYPHMISAYINFLCVLLFRVV